MPLAFRKELNLSTKTFIVDKADLTVEGFITVDWVAFVSQPPSTIISFIRTESYSPAGCSGCSSNVKSARSTPGCLANNCC
jgi:hypothetical protein